MSYCVNPECSQPKNRDDVSACQSCGARLLIRNRYKATRSLGQGGFGATFMAIDVSLPGEPICVIKQLRPSNNQPRFLEMAGQLFAREAKTLGKIGTHPQIPRLLDFFDEREIFYLVQDYVDGITLHQEVKRQGLFDEGKIREFLVEVLPILSYIHKENVIHRDIKPANIIRRGIDQKMVLIDFGAVRDEVSTLAENTGGSGKTAFTKFAVGTSGFAPPEQLAMRPVFSSDIYALGVTAIYLMTGKSPKDMDYHPQTGEMMWQKLVQISPQLTSILTKMLEPSVRHRFQTADEVFQLITGSSNNRPQPGMPMGRAVNAATPSPYAPTSRPQSPAAMAAAAGESRSPAQRLAQKIRDQQKLKTTELSSADRPPGTPNAPAAAAANTPGNIVRPAREPMKLDAVGLMRAYQRGQRTFNEMDLSQVKLPRLTNLAGINLEDANCSYMELQEANLVGGRFSRTDFSNSMLKGANLAKGQLSYANLQNADLRGVNLKGAYLNFAKLTGANLCGADLTDVKVSDEQLATAKTNFMTIFPNGKRGGVW
jgi:serine/threonine-protein kinase